MLHAARPAVYHDRVSTALTQAFVGLGANLGDRLATLRLAVARLGAAAGGRVLRCSPVYETAPQGPIREQPPFLNAVCAVATGLPARDLLTRLLEVERSLGRVRDVPQGPRTIDLDLLLYGAAVVDEPGLELPHPRLHERAFVLVPLLDLAPDLHHPRTGASLRALCAGLRDQAATPFAPASALLADAAGRPS
jgi:2-amino-4-hydroxy-6-hydroxymethyldihydropteridine diphosphokinase